MVMVPIVREYYLYLRKDKNNTTRGLLITLDCGTTAHEPLQHIANEGIDTIVIDHHLADDTLPAAHSVINPNRKDDNSGLGYLAAVGVTFLVCVALNRYIQQQQKDHLLSEINLMSLLDLVALGTICDVVPLFGLNRAYVNTGLKVMNNIQTQRAGIKAILMISGCDENKAINSYDLGFMIGPRINAGGRIGDSKTGVRLLTTNDASEAELLARELETFNQIRKNMEFTAIEQAKEQIEALSLNEKPYILAVSDEWHQGIIGIVAGRIKEQYNLPTFVLTFRKDENYSDDEDHGHDNKNEDNSDDTQLHSNDIIGKASARGTADCDVGAVIKNAVNSGILLNGGGHKMAGGLSIVKSKLPEFEEYMQSAFKGKNNNLTVLKIDAGISLAGVNQNLLSTIDMLQPFGSDYPSPRFIFTNINVIRSNIVGKNHVSCILCQGDKSIRAILFHGADSLSGKELLKQSGKLLHITGYLTTNIYNNIKTFQIIIDDVMIS